jgi:hypothetical protein
MEVGDVLAEITEETQFAGFRFFRLVELGGGKRRLPKKNPPFRGSRIEVL